jgi:hypothetical protein
MGVPLGAFREEALDVCPALYGKASGTPHGGVADPARAAALYRQLLAAARELPVPLPGRAGRVLELAARPPQTGSRRRGNWPAGDPRATTFFFHSGPAAAWQAPFTSGCWLAARHRKAPGWPPL